jgi:chemotaxis protein MotB
VAKKKKHEEHVNHERWLVSYADFITLLFAFFTSLYAISTVDAKKAGKLVFSTRAAFNLEFFPSKSISRGDAANMSEIQPMEGTKGSGEARGQGKGKGQGKSSETTSAQDLLKNAHDLIKTDIFNKKMPDTEVRIQKNSVVIGLPETIYFASGKTELSEQVLPYLDQIAKDILKTSLYVRVEGYTDEVPVKRNGKEKYRSNWELSVLRALSVAQYFLEQFSFPPESISIAGYSSYRPVDADASQNEKSRNRRIDLVLLLPNIAAKPEVEEDEALRLLQSKQDLSGDGNDKPVESNENENVESKEDKINQDANEKTQNKNVANDSNYEEKAK